jgi:hypothetical protein
LEAELGMRPNSRAEPDLLGWEIKQLGATALGRTPTSSATLMTPNPTGGLYKSLGASDFVRTFGYSDLMGREDRLNFGGIHRTAVVHPRTGLRLTLIGYDSLKHAWTGSDARLALVDSRGTEAASWSFADLLAHWNRKHARAAYATSEMRTRPHRQYRYDRLVRLGVGTDFQRFLASVEAGFIYYDPGLKLERVSSRQPKVKERHQFRIRPAHIISLYSKLERVDVVGGPAATLTAADPW